MNFIFTYHIDDSVSEKPRKDLITNINSIIETSKSQNDGNVKRLFENTYLLRSNNVKFFNTIFYNLKGLDSVQKDDTLKFYFAPVNSNPEHFGNIDDSTEWKDIEELVSH